MTKMKTKTAICKSHRCQGEMRVWQFFNKAWACWYCGEVKNKAINSEAVETVKAVQARLL